MPRPSTKLATACLVLLASLCPSPAIAGPIDPSHVAADAKWYVHLDLDAAKQTVLYAKLLEAVRAEHPVDDTVAQLKQFIGVNPLTDLQGVTLYNTSFQDDVAVAVIYAKGVDQNLLTNVLAQNREYKESSYNKHALLAWTDDNNGKRQTGCFYAPGIVLLGDKEETLKRAIDVLDGAKPGGSPLVKPQATGAFLHASADLGRSEDKNVSQLLSNSEAATARAAEAEGKLTATVSLTARNAETGAQIQKMLDGMQAFGELATAREHPTLAALIRQVRVAADGTRIVVTFSHDSNTVLDVLQKLDGEQKAKTAKDANADKPQGL